MKKALLLLGTLFLSSCSSYATNCVAHRGNNAEYFENSMFAIISAVEVGSDGVEFDILHTLDGIPIVFHDKKLKRLAKHRPYRYCHLDAKIHDLTFKEIRQNCILKNGEDIPTLEEVLIYLNSQNIIKVLEFKDLPNRISFRLIERYIDDPSLLRIISFKYKALERFEFMGNRNPYFKDIPLLFLYPMFVKLKDKYGFNIRFTERGLRKLSKYKGQRATGVWTVDDPNDMKLVIKKDIDYLTTNNPKMCLELKRRYQ